MTNLEYLSRIPCIKVTESESDYEIVFVDPVFSNRYFIDALSKEDIEDITDIYIRSDTLKKALIHPC